MTAPNIEMIAASLRGCSLARGGRGGEASPPPSSSNSSSPATPSPPHHHPNHLTEGGDENSVITVELNSETALPYHWEQRLDIRTGEVYYINWQTGTRTTEDPRTYAAAGSATYQSNYYYSGDEDEDDNDDDTSLDEDSSSDIGCDDDDYDDTADSSSMTALSSPSHPGASAASTEHTGQILVAAGCKSCFMYFMVPKRVEACPKCGGGLLHLGRNGCV